MGQTASILGTAGLYRPPLPPTPQLDRGSSAIARLIPGANNPLGRAAMKKIRPVVHGGSWISFSSMVASGFVRAAVELRPQCVKQFRPAMLGAALLDVIMILLVFSVESMAPGTTRLAPPAAVAGFFVVTFALFAIQEGLYSSSHKSGPTECWVAAKAALWAISLTGFALYCSPAKRSCLPLLFLGCLSVCALCGMRRISRYILGGFLNDDSRNVLIVGSEASGQRIAAALEGDLRCRRSVKGFLGEDHFRGIYGSSRLRTMARERCIDEVIIATHDSAVAEAAILEALRNQLDVRVMPQLFVFEPLALELETFAGIPLVKVCEQRLPEWTLAVKRIADVTLAAAGLIALFPLLFLIAVVIKVDSPGPVLYRAPRVGRKKRNFICYKFRTMVREADAAKEALRASNERDGAFFKIKNDPRVTRTGWFLRRYSFDELPQLWNVLRGEMSLVGPRPHPPDDVERYQVEHLQRLDFVPGMTGLWQVTARRERSFERSVTLDVEYIQKWSLALDLQILWRTIPAVFQGSGA